MSVNAFGKRSQEKRLEREKLFSEKKEGNTEKLNLRCEIRVKQQQKPMYT